MGQENMQYGQYALAICLVFILACCGVWDAYATFSGERWATVSAIIREWSARMPAFPFVVGLLGGHLFLT